MPIGRARSSPDVGGAIGPTAVERNEGYIDTQGDRDNQPDWDGSIDDYVPGSAGGVAAGRGESDVPAKTLQDRLSIPASYTGSPEANFLHGVAAQVDKPEAKTLTRAEVLTGALRLLRVSSPDQAVRILRGLQNLDNTFTPAPRPKQPRAAATPEPAPEQKVRAKDDDWTKQTRDVTPAPAGADPKSVPAAETQPTKNRRSKHFRSSQVEPVSSLGARGGPTYRTASNNPELSPVDYTPGGGTVPRPRSGEHPGSTPVPSDFNESNRPLAMDPADDLYIDLNELSLHDPWAAAYGRMLHGSGPEWMASPGTKGPRMSLTELEVKGDYFTQLDPALFQRLAAGLKSEDGAIKPWWSELERPKAFSVTPRDLPDPVAKYVARNQPTLGTAKQLRNNLVYGLTRAIFGNRPTST